VNPNSRAVQVEFDVTDPGSSLVARLEREEMERRLEAVHRKEARHLFWMVMGISPAAILPALGLLREGSFGLLVLLAALVTISQWYSWTKASREAERLEKAIRLLREEE
jgi:hypothetical protein